MSDARQALFSAIHAALTADAALAGILAGDGVFDHVPRGAAHPFVSFGDCNSRPLDGDDPPSEEHRFEVLVHSRAPGRQEASDIAARIEQIMDAGSLAPGGVRLITMRLRDTAVAASRDRRAYRVRMRFEALTEIA